MKVIIAGCRDLLPEQNNVIFREEYYRRLDELDEAVRQSGFEITEVVSGGARGADWLGENWAVLNGLCLRVFPADWKQYGKRAGHLRNQQMADYAKEHNGAVILLWDGNSRGTGSMKRIAESMGLPVYVHKVTLVEYARPDREMVGV